MVFYNLSLTNMALEISIRENCAGLSSDRATERKKCAESLKSFLSGASAPAMLNENTLKRTGYAWDNVFSQVNDYILKEAENYEKSKTFENTTKPLATSLLHMVITGSKKGKAYIKCDKIISACLFILKSQRLTKAIGDAYLNLLYKYIITSEYYVGFITPQSWDELLDVCLATSGSSHSKLDNYTKLRLVCLILRNGSRTCQFVGPLRDALPRVQKLFLAPTTDKRVQEVLIEMSLLLVETLSSEYRLATCEFTEAILGTIFKFYDQTIDKKKLLLYKLLHKMVLIHHPEGRLRNEEGSLAHNWTTWCKHLNSIVELICSEVKVMQKSSDTKFRFKDDSARDSAEFFCLAASVFYQIFNIPVQVNENEAGNASKRQKFSFTQKKAFSDLVDELRQNHVPWLGVVTMYVKHYGDKISTAECLSLLPILDSYIASNNNNLNWAIFEELACLVLGKLYPVTSRNDESGILLLAVWNSCVRNSTAGDAVHRATHSILQCLLRRESINFQNVQSLMKLYHEKAMPVTDHSVKTLCYILHAFFSKFNNTTEKFKCSNWFTQNDLCCSDMGIVQNLLLRLISNENIDFEANPKANKLEKSLYDVLFKSLEKCILFSEFELEISKPIPCSNFKIENVEISNAVKDHIRNSLEQKLSELTEKVKSKELKLVDYAKFISIVLNYLDIVLKFTKVEINRLKETQIYDCFKVSLKLLFASLTEVLKHCDERPEDIVLTNIVRSLLSADCNRAISCEVRACMNKDLLISIHTVINNNNPNHEEDDMEVEDLDERTVDMRRNCMYLLAAYCKINTDYRTEIVDLISSQELYNFHNDGDIKCAIQCMSILIDSTVESPPIESVFGLISFMCKRLFSNSKATGNLLKILLLVLEEIWLSPSDVTKHNCGVIFNSYLSRCKQFYYPPNVAALIYECVAKIEQINQRLNHGNKYRDSLIEGTSGDIHSLRLYCCYLVKMVANDYNAGHVQSHITRSLELFSIDVSGKNEQMLKDELANRTLTVLHSFFALAQTKSALSSYIIKAILKVQKEKSLDKNLVKKVLNKMATIMSVPEISVYLKQNILSLLHFWFSEKYPLEDLPIYLVGFNDLSTFIDSHMKWVCPAEILWCKEGNIQQSEILQRLGTDVKSTVESCFSNIMILCLPYIVTQKYNLQYEHSENELVYIQSARNAEKMFRSTNQILESKFSSLFIDKIGELVLLSASHLADYEEVKNIFGFDVPRSTESFFYPKEVYLAILKYFGDVANHDIMHFLCEQQPMIISKIILKLWSSVLQNNILESKAQALHTFITFIDSLKSGYSADHFVCNFACNSLLYAIKSAKNSEETKLLLETLRILLRSFLPDKSDLLRETLPLVVSLLKIKRDEGFEADCRPLLDIVLSEDHVDSKMLLSQRDPQTSSCISGTEFKDSLKTYLAGLSCPSFEVLSKLKRFLKANRGFINSWCRALNLKGFSEDCKMSLLHKIINILNNILTSAADDKTKIEACNCLSELGTYDLKTLVMVAPADSKNVADLKPAQYFAMVVLKHLSQLLADEDPLVVSKVIATLSRLLMFREGKLAFDLTDYDQQQILKQFNPAKSNFTTAKFQVNKTKFEAYKRLDFWLPQHTESHSKWICRITCALLHVITSGDNYLSNLGVVCKSKPCLSKTVLPPLLGLLLSISNHSEVTTIGGQINKFFNFFWDNTFNASCSENSENMTRNSNVVEHDHKLIIQDVLDVVNFVRLQRNHYIKRPDEVETYNYLKLDYDIVSWAAAICDDSLAAIFYGELWASSQNNSVPPSSPEQTANLVGGENMQSILRKCSISIGELDAIEGCGSGHLTSEQEKRKHLINTGQYADALLFHDIALSHDTNSQDDFTLEYGVVRSLHKSGMHRLALQYIKSLPENDRLDDVKYDCLSFLGDWSVFVDTNETNNKLSNPNTDMNSLLKELRYSCLKDSLNLQLETQEYEHKLVAPLNKVKLAVSKLSQKLNMDNCQSVYSVVSQLQIFNDIEDYNSVKSNKLTMKELLNKWQVEKLAPFQDFKHVETLVSQRCLILDNATKLYSTLQNDIVNLQLRYAELGLSNDRIQLSQRLLAMAKRGQTTGEVSLVEGQIAWAKGHKDIALSLLRNIMNNETPDIKLTAIALRQYGTWMAESKCENARDIIDKYLHRSLHVLGRSDNAVIRLKVYYDLAKFADAEYKQVVAYMKSTIFENKVKVMENMKNAASAIKNTQSLSRDEKKALVTNQRLSNLDEAEIQSTIAEKKRFLDLAMKYYLLSLKKDEENNLSVFRIISLWLDNPEFEFEPGEGDTFETLLNAVPSRKYVPVLPQLAPRLSNIDDAFSHNLNEIIKRCSRDHPHHTLPILFGLKNSDKDKVILNASAGIGKGRGMGGGSEELRVIAAGELIQELASTDKKLACIISQMDLMCDAIISFANYELKSKESRQAVPKAEPISKLGGLGDIPIPTITLTIKHDCNYSNFPGIVSFGNTFEMVGGINCPKKMMCKGSDGKERTILVKGEDDLRQDAVMQQVFNIVNTLLGINPVTSRKKLLIRTYKVVPLSRRSGVLEWCEGTVPLGAYLADNGSVPGAHRRYRPRDISCNAARAKLTECHNRGKSNAEKLSAFLKILKEFKPVFHFFFFEHYLDPVTWYERRLAYTKSVATSSMVGYIMGLGDRHVQNILVDKKTAEVIHIDFGIAFDQGKALPTPETVPFRLTQDMIAGFGCSGVEGIFRRCCEKTMQLLRDNHEALLTILEVLLCDPLYSWTVTPAEAKRKQDIVSSDVTFNITGAPAGGGGLAERALLAVSSKLSGTEGGVAGGVAVPGQVARLLHSATNPTNLSRLFPGWQPYL